ncbi:putative bifunctional diguanylate cyclase/phosphodiesterase [Pseudidiomarina sediminum]|uniref:putative bifunctional diguanylate cyclase/phosphodiesterase n=1 Tax=Pseudidiomarina sediminum TaxID=431675 RepID=UPI001C9840C5|nr:EAL domain-containing protein [Pseudidiomarina sediminum]MBY6063411.1 EAL domain-containing protein [Pseudidiomarina sediminum]
MFINFRARLFLLFLALAGSVLVATLAAVSFVTSEQASRSVSRELNVSERVLSELLRVRGEQLQLAAQVLADDFGFREAVATNDRNTLISAMVNHGERIGTELMALYRPDGTELASTHPNAAAQLSQQPEGLLRIDAALFQLVTVPVKTPDLIAYATLGFRIDNALAGNLKSLTNADITFFDQASARIFASSLSLAQQQSFQQAMREQQLAGWLNAEDLAAQQAEFSQTNLLLSLEQSQAQQSYNELRAQYFVFGLAALLIALLLAYISARWVHRPLVALTQATQRIGQGDFSTQVQVQQQDEFGRLGEAFNQMCGAIAEREQQITYLAEHDVLTRLPNRVSFQQTFEQLLVDGKGSGYLAVLNLQKFRSINDRLGQQFGDRVLCEVAQQLSESFSDAHLIARLAGDEFVLVYTADGMPLEVLQTRLARFIEAPWLVGSTHYRLKFRCGMVRFPNQGDAVDVLIRRAELAARRAEQANDILAVYQSGSDEAYLRRLQILQALPEAIEQQHLQLHYQAKLDCQTGRLLGVEALVRWQHPQLGVVRPDEFIPLAEESGDILRVTRWVCQHALDQQQLWLEQALDLQVSVNLSAVDLQSDTLVQFLQEQLDQRGLAPQKLTLEVTESAIMADPDNAIQRLQQLRDRGIKVALDDFGTGYASLAQLKQLPLDKLKLDQSFIRHLRDDPKDQIIVQTTLAMAQQLNLQCVAEGVEDAQAWQLLRELGCEIVQGYYFSRPLAVHEFGAWVQTQAASFLLGDSESIMGDTCNASQD